MKNYYFILVDVPTYTVPFNYFDLAHHRQIVLSSKRRICSMFSSKIAKFGTQVEAEAFLEGVKKKPFWQYSIQKMTDNT